MWLSLSYAQFVVAVWDFGLKQNANFFPSQVSILRGLKERYEVHHGVRLQDAALVSAAQLSHRYIADRFLPDKAIDLVDEAAAKLNIEVSEKCSRYIGLRSLFCLASTPGCDRTESSLFSTLAHSVVVISDPPLTGRFAGRISEFCSPLPICLSLPSLRL